MGGEPIAPGRGKPNKEALDGRRLNQSRQDGVGVPIEDERRPCRGHDRPDLLPLVVAAAARLTDIALLRVGRRTHAKDGRVIALPTPMAAVRPQAAGHPALIAETMEAPPGGVDAGRAVRAAPGAGRRHEPRDQEGHEQRQHSCQADRFCHNVTQAARSHSLQATRIIGHER